ncbi:MAG: RidA family protein [Roseiarcus sp.]|jgi:enamine deaminase RidA (YjgF/YER057c/UK114 family)
MHQILQPEGWARPVGYSNGVAARGRLVFTGGQIGWNADCRFESDDLLDQIGRTLANIAAVLREAGATPQHITTMTWFLTDLGEYRGALKRMGPVYRAVMGRHFPPMAVVGVAGLVEPRAKVEIQATAVIPD